MGIFTRKLDYSSGNGALPRLDENEYSILRLPSLNVVAAPNFKLAELEKKHGKYSYFLELVSKNIETIEENPLVIKLVDKYLGTFVNILAPQVLDVKSDAFQNIGRFMTVGIAFAEIEFQSNLQIPDKKHPSLSNALVSLTLDISKDINLKNIFKDVENLPLLLELAIEIGYLAQRSGGNISTQEMFSKLRG